MKESMIDNRCLADVISFLKEENCTALAAHVEYKKVELVENKRAVEEAMKKSIMSPL